MNNLLSSLRDRWQSDDSVRAKVNAWIRETWGTTARRRQIRQAIRDLWKAQSDHWRGVYAVLLSEAHNDGLTDEDAHRQAVDDLRHVFMDSLEVQIAERLDDEVKWMFVGNPAFRALLESVDGTLFATLVSAARVSLSLGLNRVKLLTDGAEVVSDEIAGLLAAFQVEEGIHRTSTPLNSPQRPEHLRAAPSVGSLLSPEGDTIQPIEDGPVMDAGVMDEEDDDTAEEEVSDEEVISADEEPTRITTAPDPTDAPSAATAKDRLKHLTESHLRAKEREDAVTERAAAVLGRARAALMGGKS